MIFVDANILIYSVDRSNLHHERAKIWLDEVLSGDTAVYLCWPVISAFIRISTNQHVFERPMSLHEAINRVQGWLDQPCVRIAIPTKNHWKVFLSFLITGQALGNIVMDAHIAALTVEYGCTLYSTDADFARFKGLKWVNPLV
ncbi:MAG: type II toxin-antitoxin system VapC family toxin [Spirochaetes bacterium]|nr:MAG: type II toxin-antitoxin system VapC family toxin [Spirochaetota bacterium]